MPNPSLLRRQHARARPCDVTPRTVLTILKLAGTNCERLLTEKVCGIAVGQIQADEIWTFVKVKQGHLRPNHDETTTGDAYTFIALDRTSKLVVAWHLASETGSTQKTSSRKSVGPRRTAGRSTFARGWF